MVYMRKTRRNLKGFSKERFFMGWVYPSVNGQACARKKFVDAHASRKSGELVLQRARAALSDATARRTSLPTPSISAFVHSLAS